MVNQNLEEFKEMIKKADFSDSSFSTDFFSKKFGSEQYAYLNWRFESYSFLEQFSAMGDAYFDFQYDNLWRLLTDNSDSKADGWIFPSLFCTVHGIECYLKGFYGIEGFLINKLEGDPNPKIQTKKGHNIQNICTEVIANVKKLDRLDSTCDWSDWVDKLGLVKTFIDFIYSKTNKMSAFRYPFDDNYGSVFYSAKSDVKDDLENLTINLPQYFVWLVKVHEVLEQFYLFIDSYITV